MPLSILSRRKFLQLGGVVMAATALPTFLRARLTGPLDAVSILHTTDLHGNILPTSSYDGIEGVGGLARCASRIRQWRSMNPHSLLIDAGDVYQGTDVGHRTRGQVMTRCFNHLDYDAWVLGNHEFDWGADVVRQAMADSAMPVLSSNAAFEGVPALDRREAQGGAFPLPFLLKEVNGYRIALIGATTPNMEKWFLPELLGDVQMTDPVASVRQSLNALKPLKPDAILLIAHMGIRPWMTEDDEANRLFGITTACPELDAIIGGHTHRSLSNERINGIPYTQAGYFGIHVGRLDLIFNRDSRELIHAQPMLSYMDSKVPLDPQVLALAKEDLEASEHILAEPVGELLDPLDILQIPGKPSGCERLIATSILAGLGKRKVAIDAVFHGLLYQRASFEAGPKTIRDLWDIIPFENFIVIAHLTAAEIRAIAEEAHSGNHPRSLIGAIRIRFGRKGRQHWIRGVETPAGINIQDNETFCIAFNSYDAAGAGSRFPQLRKIIDQPSAKRTLLPYQSRALLIEYFRDHSPVRERTLAQG